MASHLNCTVNMVGRIGEDFGPEISSNFKNNNINIDYLFSTEGTSSGIANIIVEQTG